jgi:putative two-component system response regulator
VSQNDTRPVILAVDDAEDLLALIGKALASEYGVKLAADGGDALTHAAEAPQPDLILLDVEMPGASGYEICQLLKEDPATAHIPVIFLTGKVEPAEQLEGLARELLADSERRATLGAAARRRVLAEHTWRHRVEELLTVALG